MLRDVSPKPAKVAVAGTGAVKRARVSKLGIDLLKPAQQPLHLLQRFRTARLDSLSRSDSSTPTFGPGGATAANGEL